MKGSKEVLFLKICVWGEAARQQRSMHWDESLNYPNAVISLSSKVACSQPERFKSGVK